MNQFPKLTQVPAATTAPTGAETAATRAPLRTALASPHPTGCSATQLWSGSRFRNPRGFPTSVILAARRPRLHREGSAVVERRLFAVPITDLAFEVRVGLGQHHCQTACAPARPADSRKSAEDVIVDGSPRLSRAIRLVDAGDQRRDMSSHLDIRQVVHDGQRTKVRRTRSSYVPIGGGVERRADVGLLHPINRYGAPAGRIATVLAGWSPVRSSLVARLAPVGDGNGRHWTMWPLGRERIGP